MGKKALVGTAALLPLLPLAAALGRANCDAARVTRAPASPEQPHVDGREAQGPFVRQAMREQRSPPSPGSIAGIASMRFAAAGALTAS